MNPQENPQMQKVAEIDKMLRQLIAEYYNALLSMNDPAKSVDMLAEHVAMMVDMINEFKK